MNFRLKVTLLVVILLALSLLGAAQTVVNTYPAWGDPCQRPDILKLSTPVNVTTATTTELVPLVAGKITYVCGYTLTSVGTGVITFEYGSGTACATSPTAVTGPFLIPTTTSQTTSGDRGVQFATASGKALCLVTGSGVTSVNGWVNYVQK